MLFVFLWQANYRALVFPLSWIINLSSEIKQSFDTKLCNFLQEAKMSQILWQFNDESGEKTERKVCKTFLDIWSNCRLIHDRSWPFGKMCTAALQLFSIRLTFPTWSFAGVAPIEIGPILQEQSFCSLSFSLFAWTDSHLRTDICWKCRNHGEFGERRRRRRGFGSIEGSTERMLSSCVDQQIFYCQRASDNQKNLYCPKTNPIRWLARNFCHRTINLT